MPLLWQQGEWKDGYHDGRGILLREGNPTQVFHRAGTLVEPSTPVSQEELDALIGAVREAARRGREVWERTLRVLGEHEHDWRACTPAGHPPRRPPPPRTVTAHTQRAARTATAKESGGTMLERGEEAVLSGEWEEWRDRAAWRISQARQQAAAAKRPPKSGTQPTSEA
mmetsp:Transcript_4783/g.9728  ORF Transcript_4783/g.9728 Transcript_4783/m.9728 type:complete len:169 (+) Transcript_4783:37-543(+)